MGNANAKELLGQDVRTLKDQTGKNYGQEIYAAGQKPEGEITEVSYLFVKPTDPKPAVQDELRNKGGQRFRLRRGLLQITARGTENFWRGAAPPSRRTRDQLAPSQSQGG